MSAIEKLTDVGWWEFEEGGLGLFGGEVNIPQARAEYNALLARIEELESQLEIACHVKATDKVKFDWQILETLDNQRERIKELEGEKERADSLEAMIDRMAGTIIDKDAEIFHMKRVVEAARIWKLEIMGNGKDTDDWAELCGWTRDERELIRSLEEYELSL